MRTILPCILPVAVLGISTGALPAVAAPARPHAAHGTDRLQATLMARTGAAEAKLAAARKTGRLSAAEASRIARKLAWIRTDSAKYVRQQGFLSAGESASYNRALDEIEARLG